FWSIPTTFSYWDRWRGRRTTPEPSAKLLCVIARHHLLRFSGLLVVFVLVAAACGGGSAGDQNAPPVEDTGAEPSVLGTTTEPADSTTTEVPPELSGALRITGSSTVEGITRAVADRYAERQPNVTIEIDAVGSGGGINDLCTDPEISVIGASRPMNGSESAICLSNGVRPIELRLARDGIAVIANNASDLQCLTYTDLYALTGPESTGLSTREAVGSFASELGSTTAWGSGEVYLIAPGPNHGTHQLFVDFVLEPIAGQRGVGTFMRPDHRSLDSNAQLVDAVAADPAGFGLVGSSYAARQSSVVKMVGVSDGSGCVLANDAAVIQGIYPMSRDLYLYADSSTEDPLIDDFLFYYLNVALSDAVAQAEYVELSAAEQAETAARWANR
ncbi:MAG: substrate-binding domain-containing protein, partial [Acidimicrobiia bacterium]|nr:substrate-binding domain-containing protein [Acidimicrobiia bacterium]